MDISFTLIFKIDIPPLILKVGEATWAHGVFPMWPPVGGAPKFRFFSKKHIFYNTMLGPCQRRFQQEKLSPFRAHSPESLGVLSRPNSARHFSAPMKDATGFLTLPPHGITSDTK